MGYGELIDLLTLAGCCCLLYSLTSTVVPDILSTSSLLLADG